VPLQIWWSTKDRIVRDQNDESGLLYRRIRRANPRAAIVQIVGTWTHSVEFGATRRLVVALSAFALVPVHPRTQLTAAAKRGLGLPADWRGPQLALVWRATQVPKERHLRRAAAPAPAIEARVRA
jgi:hypothetical protein